MTQLSLGGITAQFGARTVFEDLSFTVARGERWGIIGRNGTGKTTLFRLILGEITAKRGSVSRASGLRIVHLEQHRDFGDAATVWEAAAGGFATLLRLEESLAKQAARLAELGERATPAQLAQYDRDLERFSREGGYTYAPRVDAVLHGLGFDPDEARTRPLERLSGGERGRIGLARQLVAPADVLLLDEPTNHLDLETTDWLDRYLKSSGETALVISHDRAFLDGLVDHVLHFEGGTATAYKGTFAQFVRQREERHLTQQRSFEQQRRFIEKEEDFIRRNIAGQNTAQAKGRRTRLARLPRLSPPPDAEAAMALRLDAGHRGGDQVLVADRVTLRTEERVLITDFSARVSRGEVVGFVGPNGAGKSTLLRAIVGEHEPVRGSLRLGASIVVAHYRQDMSQVPTDKTIYEIIQDLRPRWERGAIQGHLGRFGFSGDEVHRNAGTLSGGERARVALAMIVLARANLLLLDEPTNHLDVESIEALEDALEAYDGTVILVSHDRALLRATATRTWVLHGERITDYDGTFAEWEEVSAERAHAATVAAEEEESLRRARERKQTRRPASASRDDRAARRAAQRELERTEADVARLEAQVAELTAALEDPDLYTTPGGVDRAQTLGAELDTTRAALDEMMARWERAVATMEAAGPLSEVDR
ncbi:MAG TPA: ABC-F family ATP-binding cassette domain-containing protein [Gemmatimonadaceae bacterium]|nr:ABC-F family ATP-binding cassette domain-containing protein [Gemmatimonadaceae bacterium]